MIPFLFCVHVIISGCPPGEEIPLDDYPIVIHPDDDPEGTVLIIHGTVYAKYLGRLNVVFDEEGQVSEWYGNPILLDDEVEQGKLAFKGCSEPRILVNYRWLLSQKS